MNSLDKHFDVFKQQTIGNAFEHDFETGRRQIVYADWAASGRLYRPIEEYITNRLGPFCANTHTETNLTGTVMTDAYHQAHRIIKEHVNAGPDDALLFAGFGMTAVVNKFQRILGLSVPERYKSRVAPTGDDRPLVILTHMEHHSNQTTWVECLCDVVIVRPDAQGLPDLNHLREILQENRNRRMVMGAFTSCSNVTGIFTPYHEMAEIVHEFGGYCFVDFAASAPYVEIDMHPAKQAQRLDAVFFSPHKFLGGPGASGVVVFNSELYQNTVPDHPGGGTVLWTNPWGGHRYFEDIEAREDGGTPGSLQAIKASLAVLLKEQMGVSKMLEREHELKERLMNGLQRLSTVTMLEPAQRHRLGFVSFYSLGIHYNLIVRLLNDRFGIQTRGGCSCAGTYGHMLLNIPEDESKRITDRIDTGDLTEKPGWVRISIHPTMTASEIDHIVDSVGQVIEHAAEWQSNYRFDAQTAEFEPVSQSGFHVDLRRVFEE